MILQPQPEERRHPGGEPQLLQEPPSGPDTWGNWHRVFDASSGRWYYHNTGTQVVTWECPAGWGTETQQSPPSAAQAPGSGWYYADLQGATQGPFSAEQLTGWRGVLPLELRVWHQAEGSASAQAVPLAQVTGDMQLLTLLRSGQLPLPPNATASHAEAVLAATEAAANAAGGDAWWAAHEAAQSGGGAPSGEGAPSSLFSELAAASLAGMPEDVRARVLAGDSGEVEAPSRVDRRDEMYAMQSVVNTVTGRVTLKPEVGYEDAIADARGAPREYVTAQLAHHMDVGKLNEWLQQRMEHKKPVPEAVWKVLKERRIEKKKKNNAWLRD